MRKQFAIGFAIILAAAGAFIWYQFLSYENVDVRKEVSGDKITNITLDLRDVDLILQKSSNQQITARLSGEKAKADHWTLETDMQGSTLRIASGFAQRAYLNYIDKPKRELIVSLPEKVYKDILLNLSSDWRNVSLTVQAADGTLQEVNVKKLKDPGHVETLFGNLRIQTHR